MKRARSDSSSTSQDIVHTLLMITDHVPRMPACVPVTTRLRTLNQKMRNSAVHWPDIAGSLASTVPGVHFGPGTANHIPILRFIMASGALCWRLTLPYCLVQHGRLDLLKQLDEYLHGALSRVSCPIAIEHQQVEVFRWLLPLSRPGSRDSFARAIVRVRNLDLLRCLLAECPSFSDFVQLLAATKEWTIGLEWMLANNFLPSVHVYYGAVDAGSTDMIQWLRERNYPFDEAVCVYTAGSLNFHLFSYLHENGFPWGTRTCSSLAYFGRLNLLTWAREHGCPWDGWTAWFAAREGHFHIVRWSLLNGCPWSLDLRSMLSRHGRTHFIDWALSRSLIPDDEPLLNPTTRLIM